MDPEGIGRNEDEDAPVVAAKEPFDEEKTGWGWKVLGKIDTQNTVVPTTCKMNRPS